MAASKGLTQKQKKFCRTNIVYKTINNINGKEYIGIHTTNNINDGYLGSGTEFKKAVREYGRENFRRIIIAEYDSRINALKKEKELVTGDYVKNEISYNLCKGGNGNPNDSYFDFSISENYQVPKYCNDFESLMEFYVDEIKLAGFKDSIQTEINADLWDIFIFRKQVCQLFLSQIQSICLTMTNYWNDKRFHEYAENCINLLNRMGFNEILKTKQLVLIN
ncbi:MAG: hypothetical protein WC886_07905 [Saccharofermentanaceae bacterium]|jgi:hypothetical protein